MTIIKLFAMTIIMDVTDEGQIEQWKRWKTSTRGLKSLHFWLKHSICHQPDHSLLRRRLKKSSHTCLDNMILGQLKIGEHQAKWSALVGLSKYSNVVQWSPNANAESCWWSLISLIYRKLTFPHGQRPSSAHHPLEADSASELQRYFASGANHSLRTPGNHVNCQISILGNSSENSFLSFSLEPLLSGWQAGGGWVIGRWRRTADTRGQFTAGGNRDCENRRLSSALPFFPACLPFDC